MCKQRLCQRTEEKTRKFVNEIVKELKKSDDPFLRAVGYCCRPQCWWNNGCTELKGCGLYESKNKLILEDYFKDCIAQEVFNEKN